MNELKKFARITAISGLFVIIFFNDSITEVSFISSRLIKGTLSLILKQPKIAKAADRMSINLANPLYIPLIVILLLILGSKVTNTGTSDGIHVPKSSKNFVVVIRLSRSAVFGVML